MPSPKRQPRCYAHWLGECNAMSREHVATKGIFGDALSVQTFGMGIPNGTRVGIKSSSANILCNRHNALLNNLDDEIIALANAVGQFREKPVSSSVSVDGKLIERWMLKFIVGMCAAGYTEGRKLLPTADTVRQVFGLEPMPERFVLYGVSVPAIPHEWNRMVSFHAFRKAGHEVKTCLLMVNDLPLLAHVSDDDPLQVLQSTELINGFETKHAKVVRRPRQTQLTDESAPDQRLTINFSY